MKKMENPTLLCGISSLDLLSGIQLLEKWQFADLGFSEPLEDIFKVSLSNVYRQDSKYFQNVVITTAEIDSLDIATISSVFHLQNKSLATYYSVTFILRLSAIRKYDLYHPSLQKFCKVFAKRIRNSIIQKESLKKYDQNLSVINSDLNIFFKSGVEPFHEVNIEHYNVSFYAICLTSHLQTDMTSVIEISENTDYKNLANFLLHFTFPFKRKYASFVVHDHYIPGLSIQIVTKQSRSDDDIFRSFKRPITYIKLQEKKVFSIRNIHYAKRNSTTKKEKKSTKYIQIPAPWPLATVSIVMEMPDNKREEGCKVQLESLTHLSLLFLSVVAEKVPEGEILSQSTINDICHVMKIAGKDDFQIVLSVASQFDPSIINKYIKT